MRARPTATSSRATYAHHRARDLLCAALLLIAGSVGTIALAAPPARISAKDLRTIHSAANEELRAMGSRCESAVQGDAADLEAQAIYGRSAQNLAWVARQYPYPATKDGGLDRSEHTLRAVQIYERAFNCNPQASNRHYIDDALALIVFRQQLVSEDEKQDPETQELLLQLTQAENQLRVRLGGLQPLCETPAPPTCPAPPIIEASPADDGPLNRVLDTFALSIEIGTGASVYRDDGNHINSLFILTVVPSYRLTFGKHDRHRMHLGFLHGMQAGYYGNGNSYIASALTAQVDYAIADETGWLVVHASLGAGFQQTNASALQNVINPGLGICVLHGILCLRGRTFLRLRDRESRSARDFWTIALGIDPIRLITRKSSKSDRS